ncbi:MAG: YrhB domain-containing protein [Bacteroidota bacterium]
MLDLDAAREVAQSHLDGLDPIGSGVALDERHTIERPFGWVFFYDSVTGLETGDLKDRLVGNAPLIVDRRTGELHVTGTAHPIAHYIAAYESSRREP